MRESHSQIESMVEDHQKEIKRRREGYEEHMRQREDGSEPIGFCNEGSHSNEPFKDPTQRFVVFNLSHIGVPPRVTDGGDPGIRLCGVFTTQEEAVHHAKGLAATDPDCSVLLTPTHEWSVMCSTLDMMADIEAIGRLKTERLEEHQKQIKAHREDFERRRSDLGEEEGGVDVHDQIGGSDDKERSKDDDSVVDVGDVTQREDVAKEAVSTERREYLGSFRRDAELREQSVAVVSFLPDASGASPAHTMFCVWRVFSTEADAEDWILNVAGNHVSDFSFDTVSLYEWLKPQSIETSDIRKVTYRNKEQANIMTFASNQRSTIDSFKQECTKKGHNTPYIDI